MKGASELISEVRKLRLSVNKLNSNYSFLKTFLRAVISGFGGVIGATLVVAFFVYLLRQVNLIPLIGDWLSAVTKQVLDNLNSGQT